MRPYPVLSEIVVAKSRANRACLVPLLAELLPPGAIAAELPGEADPVLLFPEEQKGLARASLKRAREFTAGRLCARRALAQFGIADHALIAKDNHCPRWPLHMVGSIAHTGGYSAAVVAERARFRSIGLDAETVGRVTENIWNQVLRASERDWLRRLPQGEQAEVATLLFSAREAFFKCQYAVTGQLLEFQDVAIDLAGWTLGAGVFSVRPLLPLALFHNQPVVLTGRFRFDGGRVVTAIALNNAH